MADGRIPPSHAGRTGQPAGRPAEYLRALLIGHGALPARNEPPARLERWVAPGITETEDRRTVNAYAAWPVLHRATTPRRAATGERALSADHASAIAAMTSSSPWDWRGHYGGYRAQ